MEILFTQEAIQARVAELGREINQAYRGQDLTVVGILNGCFMFMGDLCKQFDASIQIDFARLSSYGNSDCPDEVKLINDLRLDIRDRHVLIVDDILDTGQSLSRYRDHLLTKGPRSVKVCTMIDKTARRVNAIEADFYGFRIEDGFIVGYGLDFAERYRTLPAIYVLDPSETRAA